MSENIQARFDHVFKSMTFKRLSGSLGLENKRVLDLGCGYGEYMQRFGPKSVGITTTTAEVASGTERGLDIRFGNVEFLADAIAPIEQFDVFWANNLFEHLRSPHSFLVHLKTYAHPDSMLILGVPVIPFFSSLTEIPKFRGALASPHINFFSKITLAHTVRRAGWSIVAIRSFAFPSILLDRITTPLMPHLYVIAQNNENYRYPEKKVKEWMDDSHYTDLLTIMNQK